MKLITSFNILFDILLVSLYLGSAYAEQIKLTGKIVDDSGLAVAHANIQIEPGGLQSLSNDQGNFEFNNLPSGDYKLHIFKPGYVHSEKHINFQADKGVIIHITLTAKAIDQIIVTTSPLSHNILNMSTPVNILQDETLRIKQEPTLGETLSSEPGVSASYFGPGASRPIIRGLDGARIKVLQNGLGIGDASTVSADHSVSSETSTTQRIEVLRGPATLLYGSGAIGGVVNIVDNRIPPHLTDGLTGELNARVNSVSNESNISFNLNGSFETIAWHLDGFNRNSGDYNIGGHAFRLDEQDKNNHDDQDNSPKGTLPNSFTDSTGYSLGASYIGDLGFIGISVNLTNSDYGIPDGTHNHHENEKVPDNEEYGEDSISIDLKQDRYDIHGELLKATGILEKAKLRISTSDYKHIELEGNEQGTIFKNESIEARLELIHQEFDNHWHGVFGIQWLNRDFSALGEEAFTPYSNTKSLGIFLIEEKQWNKWHFEIGARYESQDLKVDPIISSEIHHYTDELENSEHFQLIYTDKNHNSFSFSIGSVWKYTATYSFSTSLSYSQRAPTAEELFSNGEHLSTQSFELGNPDLQEETATNIDFTWRKYSGDSTATINLFYNKIDDYIYQAFTDQTINELPIFLYSQENSIFYGYEAQLQIPLTSDWNFEIFSDYVRGQIDNDDISRIPPLRIGSELSFESGELSGKLSINHVKDQHKTAEFETKTDGYTMINANMGYQIHTNNSDIWLFLKAKNLTNKNARNHSSLLKNFAPLPGRAISAGISISF